MGLDITAFRKVAKVEVELDADGEPVNDDVYDEYVRVYATGGRGQHDGLEDGAFYSAEEEFSFRAGSYGGYNNWREALASVGSHWVCH